MHTFACVALATWCCAGHSLCLILQALQAAGLKGADCVVVGTGPGNPSDAAADARVLASLLQVWWVCQVGTIVGRNKLHVTVDTSATTHACFGANDKLTGCCLCCFGVVFTTCPLRSRRRFSGCSCARHPMLWRPSARLAAATWSCATSTN